MQRKKLITLLCCIFTVGMIFVSIGIATGASTSFYIDSTGFYLMEQDPITFEKDYLPRIEAIDIDTNGGCFVDIVEGSSFSIAYEGYKNNYLTHTLEDGVLTFTDKEISSANRLKFIFQSGSFSISQSSMLPLNWSNNTIKITIPKGSILESTNIKIPSGDIYLKDISSNIVNVNNHYGDLAIDGLKGKTVTTTLQSGELSINNLTADVVTTVSKYGNVDITNATVDKLEGDLQSGSGYIENTTTNTTSLFFKYGDFIANQFYVDTLQVELQSGKFEMNGDLTSSAEINNKYGDIIFGLESQATNFKTMLTTEYGDIHVDKPPSDTHMFSQTKEDTQSKLITAHANSGNINIKFEQ